MKKLFLFIVLIVFLVSSYVFAIENISIHSYKDIRSLKIEIEPYNEGDCLTQNEIEYEIKYVLYNSNIQISKSSPFRLYVNVNSMRISNINMCVGYNDVQIYSLPEPRHGKDRIMHWSIGSFYNFKNQWKQKILSLIRNDIKKTIIWINENNN